jgi:hypothetical protein
MKIQVVRANKCYDISFDYNLKTDTPEKVAQEMKYELELKDLEIVEITKEIAKIVKQASK